MGTRILLSVWAALVSAVAVAMAADEPRAGAGTGTGGPVAVLSFNIRYANPGDGENAWPKRREQVFEILRGRERPDGVNEPFDFVGLQEALRPQLDDILGATAGVYGEIGVGRDDGKSRGEHSAVLYRKDRWACARSGTFWLSDTPEVPGSKSWGNGITRICTWGEFRPVAAANAGPSGGGEPAPGPGGPAVFVFNTHLDHQSQPSRERAAAFIVRKIAEIAGAAPVMLTGDFNAGEDNPVMRYLTGQAASPWGEADSEKAREAPRPSPLSDTFRAVHPGEKTVGTFNSFDEKKTGGDKIDFVLVSAHWKVEHAWIDRRSREGRVPSDHWAVGAVVRLK